MQQQTTIQFDRAEQVSQPIDIRATIVRKYSQFSTWLHARSEFYSRIAEFPVSRLLVLRVNLVSICLIVTAMAISQAPIVATISAICAGWLVYRFNKTQKKE